MQSTITQITITFTATQLEIEQYYNSQLTKVEEFLTARSQPLDYLQTLKEIRETKTQSAINLFLNKWLNLEDKITKTNPPEPLKSALHDFQLHSILLASSLIKPQIIDTEEKINALISTLEYLGIALTETRYPGLAHWDHFADAMQSLEKTITHQYILPLSEAMKNLIVCAISIIVFAAAFIIHTPTALAVAVVTNVLGLAYLFREFWQNVSERNEPETKLLITTQANTSLKRLSIFTQNEPLTSTPVGLAERSEAQQPSLSRT